MTAVKKNQLSYAFEHGTRKVQRAWANLIDTIFNPQDAVSFASTVAVAGDLTTSANHISSHVDYSAGAGALPITADVIFLTTGGAEALTLADGVAGQVLEIIMVSDGGDGTLTPANFGNGSTITFDNNDSVRLRFDGTNWWVVGTATAAIA